MSTRLRHLDPIEQLACLVAERTLGVVATEEDVPPKQGAVDAFLTYPDGPRAAFEVTQLATDGGASHQLDRLLGKGSWPLPGKWWWHVWISHPRDLPRLRQVFDKIVLLCEAVGVARPEDLFCAQVDADVRWLVEESSVQMRGHPTVPAVDGERVRRAMVTQPGAGGFSDETFTKLAEALTTVFDMTHIQRRLTKLRNTPADEHHLFAYVNVYDLPFGLFEALGFGEQLPAEPPALPSGLTHLWLAPVYGRRFLLGSAQRWLETPRDDLNS